ncbi:MAG: alanine--tRNA ligase [Candidatus Woesearchaeota archaeon]
MKVLTASQLKKLYLDFFASKEHEIIPSASLIPENDPTVLFTTAGMHPLVPFLLGQPHPAGKRVANVQKCIRTGDIDDVGDESHLTFFEMLGNWSFGDYFKEDAIRFSFEFLTSEKYLAIPTEKLAVTVFEGDKDAPKDEESAKIWKSLGIPDHKISFMPKKNNWWGPAGETGPCGPDSEMFYYIGEGFPPKSSNPKTDEKNWLEIWNNVFMQYNKTKEGKYEILKQKNVDTGMGVDRTAMMLQGKKSVYEIDTFVPIVKKIKELSKKPDERKIRIIADHLRAAVFILGDERAVIPSNLGQGYVLRRLIRRAVRYGILLEIENNFTKELGKVVINTFKTDWPVLEENRNFILEELDKEETLFKKRLSSGMALFEKLDIKDHTISGRDAFVLFTSHGFPLEMTIELAKEKNLKVNIEEFEKEFKKHQELSRTATEGLFRSGLADHSERTVRMHTATHLLHAALRKVLGEDVRQRGSNITPERLRFDFSFSRKLKPEEIKKVEDLVNEKIQQGLLVKREEKTLKEAKDEGAIAFFDEKYDKEKVSVYTMGDFSKEVCTGPHVNNTKEVGKFKIQKEEACSAGVRRIKATVE